MVELWPNCVARQQIFQQPFACTHIILKNASLLASSALSFRSKRIPTLNADETAHPQRVSLFIPSSQGVSDMLRSLTLNTRLPLRSPRSLLSSCLDLLGWTRVCCPPPLKAPPSTWSSPFNPDVSQTARKHTSRMSVS